MALKWRQTARDKQVTPDGDWRVWLLLSGRGFGKTTVGAHDIAEFACFNPGVVCGVIAPTHSDLRRVCFEGPAGLLSFIPDEVLRGGSKDKAYVKSPWPELHFACGSKLEGFSGSEPERLRGPQFHRVWCLSGDTLVAMGDGSEKPLRLIKRGDAVMTRRGPRTVTASAMTHPDAEVLRLTTSCGVIVLGTTNHNVYTARGFVPMGRLEAGDDLWRLSGTQSANGGCVKAAITTTLTENGYIGKFTKIATGLYRSAITSTTKTATRWTIQSGIWRRFLQVSTCPTTTWDIHAPTLRWPGSGSTNAGKKKNGAKHSAPHVELNSPRVQWEPREYSVQASAWKNTEAMPSSQRQGIVCNAATDTSPRKECRSFVLKNASRLTSFLRSVLSAMWNVPIAAVDLFRCEEMHGFVRGHAPCGTTTKVATVERYPTRLPVYDLTIEGEHEFFANGILVHNCDEVAAWSDGNAIKIREAWDMLMFCLRLGETPQAIVTTTPKPITLIGDLLKRENKDVIVTRGSTHENKANLPKSFYADIVKYEGTDLGRQEIYGEFLDPEERGIVHRSWFKLWPPGTALPPFHYVVASYKTPYSAKMKEGYVACSMWGVFRAGPKKADPFNALMFDCWHEKLAYPDFKRRVLKDWEQEYGQGTLTKEQMKSIIASPWDRPGDMVGRRPALVLISDEGAGTELRTDLAAKGILARSYTTEKDRTLRLHLASDLIKDGLAWLPESETVAGRPKTWAGEFVNQVCTYLDEKSLEHSEYVDSATQALALLRDQGWIISKMRTARPEDMGHKAPQEFSNPYAM